MNTTWLSNFFFLTNGFTLGSTCFLKSVLTRMTLTFLFADALLSFSNDGNSSTQGAHHVAQKLRTYTVSVSAFFQRAICSPLIKGMS
jgi:hypothetical protein